MFLHVLLGRQIFPFFPSRFEILKLFEFPVFYCQLAFSQVALGKADYQTTVTYNGIMGTSLFFCQGRYGQLTHWSMEQYLFVSITLSVKKKNNSKINHQKGLNVLAYCFIINVPVESAVALFFHLCFYYRLIIYCIT